MRNDLSFPPDSEIITWSRPDPQAMPEHLRTRYEDRVRALTAVINGSSMNAASTLYRVDRTVLRAIASAAVQPADDGKPHGFRACVPWFRLKGAQPKTAELPLAGAPHAFARLVSALPAVGELLAKFKGALPERHRQASSAFETLMRQFKQLLKTAQLDHAYPRNTPDQGRRAVQRWIRRHRAHLLDADMRQEPDFGATTTRLEHFFKLKPLDRNEFDAHKTDVEWHAKVPTPDGAWKVVKISQLWLLAKIDAVSLVVVAWTLVVGKGYNERDVLRTFAKALMPWTPRKLIVPDLRYASGAWMPGMVDGAANVPRAVSVAVDNYKSQSSKTSTANLGDFQLGVVNLGYSNVPEGRPHIEAFFKWIEDAILRFIAGGFRPAKSFDDSQVKVSALSPTDHPLDLEALEDLLDVLISTYNITPHLGLQGRTPKEVYEAYVATDAWVTTSTATSQDIDALLQIRVRVTVRGSREKSVLPHVNYEGARYRSAKLNERWDLIGRTYSARLSFRDLRTLTLLDDKGSVFVVLRALPPWDTLHTFDERRKVIHWRNRGLLQISGADDAIAAYHAFVREKASKMQWAADQFVRAGIPSGSSHPPSPARTALYQPKDNLEGLAPRGGLVRLTGQRGGK